jgi:hypothetical protein
MPVRSIEDWIAILKPLGYWDAADVILDDLDDYEGWRVKEAPERTPRR